MTEIVERLLIAGKLLGKTLAGYRDDDLRSAARGAVDLGQLMFDANDEIERLQAEVKKLRQVIYDECDPAAALPANAKIIEEVSAIMESE